MCVQVVEHAAAVNKLNAVEVGANAADQRMRQIRDDILAAQQAKVCLIVDLTDRSYVLLHSLH